MGNEEARLVEKGVLFELKKMEGKRWIPFDEIKKRLKGP